MVHPTSYRWRIPLVLFAALGLIYLATVSAVPSMDVLTANFAAEHLARTGEPVADPAGYPRLDDNVIRETWVVETADGREAVGRAPGVIAASVPAYWLAGQVVGDDGLRGDWWTGASALPGGVTAALLTATAVTLFFLLLRDRLGGRHALLAALLLGLTTPVWTNAANGLWPHTLTVLGIIGMAWAADREKWWLVGLFGGIALWGRLHAVLICAVLGLGVAVVRRRPAIAVRVGLASGAMLALMSVWTRWMYGRWDPSAGYRAGDFTENAGPDPMDTVNLLGFWVSPDRGLLVWTPLLVVLAPALCRGWRELPDWCRLLAAAGAGYLLVQGMLVRFSGGDAFYAYRTSLELLACLAPALALSAHRMGERARRWFLPVAVLQLVLIVPGSVVDGFYVPVRWVWVLNAFVVGWYERPLTMAVLVGGALVAAWLFLRVWRRTEVALE